MADFIYNRAVNSGGRWHLVDGDVQFETIDAVEERYRPFSREEGEGDNVRIAAEHRVAAARVRCGVATDSWTGEKGLIKSGARSRDDFMKVYGRWKKDRTQDLVIHYRYAPPLVALNPEVPPEPLCGHCAAILEREDS